jgi:hypothetical protein
VTNRSESIHEALSSSRFGTTEDHQAKARAAPVGSGEIVRRMLILVALYAIPAAVVLRPVSDNDIWMNLRAGRWIVEHMTLPATDPFSSYGQGRPWVAYSWFFEVLIHGLDAWLGLAGIVLYRVVLSYALLIALHRLVARREPRFALATGLSGLAFFALVPLLNERTWLFTLLFSTLTLDTVLDLRDGRGTRRIWLVPAVYALWANVHIQFIYGLFLLGLGCVAPLLDGVLGRIPASGHASQAWTRAWWQLVALTAACLLATLLNPYYGRLYAVVVEYAAKSETYNLVIELLASGFRMPWEWAMPVLVGAAAYRLGRRSERSTFDVILLSVATVFALRARRDVWFAVLAAVAVLSTGRRVAGTSFDHFRLGRSQLIIVASVVLVVLVALGWSLDLSQEHLEREVVARYPAKAASVIEERGYRGPLFNEYGWGSYLIWRLPNLPVSIDGRAELHGPTRIRRNVETISGVKGWDSDPDLKAAGTVVISARAALASLLRLDPRFELVHEDKLAAVFTRRSDVQRNESTPGVLSLR